MRNSAILIFVIILVSCDGFFVPKTGMHEFPGKYLGLRQKVIFEQLLTLPENSSYGNHNEVGNSYRLDEDLENYENAEVVKDYLNKSTEGSLDRVKAFNFRDSKHLEEAKSLFNVFYNAKNWDTFYKVVCWARNRVNSMVFLYAFSVALVHREDLRGQELTPIFEVLPNYFLDFDIIEKIQELKVMQIQNSMEIPLLHENLKYFTEDVGLNQFYYYYNLDYPTWMSGDEFGLNKDRRGELYLYTIRQLLARYELERLSNGLSFVPDFPDFSLVPYHSPLKHFNELDFPGRSKNHFDKDSKYAKLAKHYEQQIRQDIDNGFITLENGTKVNLRESNAIDVLGNLFQNNADSYDVKYFNEFVETLKLSLIDPSRINDISEFDYTFTELRDPASFRIFKKIINLIRLFTSYLPPYTDKEILFPGVQITEVELDNLTTLFDTYKFDIRSVFYNDLSTDFSSNDFSILQKRLQHIPFKYNLTIVSDKKVNSVIRVFIGPTFDDIEDFHRHQDSYFQVDVHQHELQQGLNSISRISSNFSIVVKDSMSIADLYKETIEVTKDNFTWNFDNQEAHCGFPERLLLPKGTENGFGYKILFFISELIPPAVPQYEGFNPNACCGVGSGSRYIDDQPLAFPLDRKLLPDLLHVPNLYFKDVSIKDDNSLKSRF